MTFNNNNKENLPGKFSLFLSSAEANDWNEDVNDKLYLRPAFLFRLAVVASVELPRTDLPALNDAFRKFWSIWPPPLADSQAIDVDWQQ